MLGSKGPNPSTPWLSLGQCSGWRLRQRYWQCSTSTARPITDASLAGTSPLVRPRPSSMPGRWTWSCAGRLRGRPRRGRKRKELLKIWSSGNECQKGWYTKNGFLLQTTFNDVCICVSWIQHSAFTLTRPNSYYIMPDPINLHWRKWTYPSTDNTNAQTGSYGCSTKGQGDKPLFGLHNLSHCWTLKDDKLRIFLDGEVFFRFRKFWPQMVW